ncbi:hypothetical protein [Blastococcus sp. SYSU DS1021]
MSWVLLLIAVWVMLGLAVAIVIGRGVRLADSVAEGALARLTEPATDTEAWLPRPAAPADDQPWPLRRGAASEELPRRGQPPGSPSVDGRLPASEPGPVDRERGLA